MANVNLRALIRLSIVLFFAGEASLAHARLEVCNKTDLVLLVAVGYDTSPQRTVSEGWWRIYPGFCEVPVDVALLEGNYYIHAESNPRSTMPGDAFSWGEDKQLCVQLSDFRIADANVCANGDVTIGFNLKEKNWRNSNATDIYHSRRSYKDDFAVKVAGVQRLLSVLGFDIGDIDGVIGKKTVAALHQVGLQKQIFGFDFKEIYPALELLIAEQHKLDN